MPSRVIQLRTIHDILTSHLLPQDYIFTPKVLVLEAFIVLLPLKIIKTIIVMIGAPETFG